MPLLGNLPTCLSSPRPAPSEPRRPGSLLAPPSGLSAPLVRPFQASVSRFARPHPLLSAAATVSEPLIPKMNILFVPHKQKIPQLSGLLCLEDSVD